ncbi:MAG: magnesium/cobalt transporter CorA [Verrucomicrobiae bacterium]|nr:magnesium/cobalt transporter CorA [Verrucomicrobiae bacterium]
MKLSRPDFLSFKISELLDRTISGSTRKAPGQSPGSLIHTGEKRTDQVVFTITEYDEESSECLATEDVSECVRFSDTRQVTWIHVTGLHDPERISELGHAFHIHPLILEDILNTDCRPKIEEFDEYIFVVAKLLYYDNATHTVDVQQLSLILLPDTSVLTFLESPSPVFDPVMERIQSGGGGRIRNSGADYLAWALLDTVVDHYFSVVDGVDLTLDEAEEKFEDDPDSLEASELYQLKKEVSALHRLVRPIRDIATILYRSESALISKSTHPFFRDLYDHAVHVLEQTEDLRENASSLRDFYLSQASNRMNEIMKVLTSFATIFMPLTFLAGIYGMNFKYMPELDWPWAYPALIGVFFVTAAVMFVLFRKKGWL